MSVLKTFRNFKLSIFILILLFIAMSLSNLNIGFDFSKIELSKTLKKQSDEMLKFDIEAGEISKQLLQEHQLYMKVNLQKIKDLYNQDFITSALLNSNTEQIRFDALQKSIDYLSFTSSNYYTIGDPALLAKVQEAQKQLLLSSRSFNEAVIVNIEVKNKLALYLTLAGSINALLIFLWYGRKLSIIYKDIKTILNVEEEDREKSFKTLEFTAIKRRMERRPMASGGKNLLDPLTSLLNEKGLLSEFAQRGSASKGYVCVTMFDIDDFKELGQMHGKNFTDSVVKKIAFIINLEKKASDIVGRIGEDQFIMITPRETQTEAFTAVDKIRESIEKTKFKASSGAITITVSGGFSPKDKHEKIESAIGAANSLVKRAKIQGKNIIMKPQAFNGDLNSRM